MKGCITHFYQKGDLEISKNDRSITLTAIDSQSYQTWSLENLLENSELFSE